jgi:hypothetical protein
MPSERRRVTVLFADLVGFSTLAEHLDPEELRGLVTETFAELTGAVESRGGVVEKFIGDAIMAIFGAPITHEDDPERAVDAALEMLEALARRSERASASLQLRIGVNSGLVVSGAVGDGTQTGVMGDAVNTAARLQQAAEPENCWCPVRSGGGSGSGSKRSWWAPRGEGPRAVGGGPPHPRSEAGRGPQAGPVRGAGGGAGPARPTVVERGERQHPRGQPDRRAEGREVPAGVGGRTP